MHLVEIEAGIPKVLDHTDRGHHVEGAVVERHPVPLEVDAALDPDACRVETALTAHLCELAAGAAGVEQSSVEPHAAEAAEQTIEGAKDPPLQIDLTRVVIVRPLVEQMPLIALHLAGTGHAVPGRSSSSSESTVVMTSIRILRETRPRRYSRTGSTGSSNARSRK
jgi:hypothetical protein